MSNNVPSQNTGATGINELVIPALNDTNYATGLNNVFNTIKDNFTILANREFVKGDSGSSVVISEEHTCENNTLTTIGVKIKSCIEAKYTNSELSSVTINGQSYGVFDNLYEPNNIVCVIKDDTNTIKGSLYYVFIDKFNSGKRAELADRLRENIDREQVAKAEETIEKTAIN